MTRAVPRRTPVLLTGTLVLSTLSACTSLGGQASLEDALEDRAEVRALTQDLAAAAAGVGLEPVDAGGVWGTCTDQGSKWQYSADALLEAERDSADELEAVLAAMVDLVGLQTDGPGTFGQDTIADGEARGLHVRVRTYDDGPELFVSVSGPCGRVDADQAELDQGDIGNQVLDIGGTHPNQQDAVP